MGDFRVIYSIADDVLVVTVVEIGNRRDVYRGRYAESTGVDRYCVEAPSRVV